MSSDSKKSILLTFVAFIASVTFVASSEIKTGADFLNIPVGARPAGMANAYTALANDITALHWNPAGLGLINQRELGAMHAPWLMNTQYNFLGFGSPTRIGTLAGSISVLSQGSEQARGENREKTGSVKAQDQALSLGWGRKLGSFQMGLGTKLIQSQIAGYKAQTFALDFGMIYPWSRSLSLGLSVQNLGPGMRFISQRDPLPLSITAGLALSGPFPGINLALDVKRQPYSGKTTVGMGTEYQVLNILSLRAGYLACLAGQSRLSSQTFSGLGAGFGIQMMGYRLDYAVTPFGELGNTHRLSLTARF